ncbi:2-oxo-4-hydroxy-4-carboxy-5-ureidoimidazoline decarboxylase [Tsukamurella ocularis]|uniref:2-oxo-4-hydroxy-4-carboxy-5-ureidoimidazoline decarboxylase n=1 Tax=Tsukamurella ocularis TaxID=1970234 RepID=UPI002168023D|nr:2-oxo-4-hydroxy-4-carboxy-5-ureidoimidazoline decarboxylase [Tsukamurella ocularis]MCS3780565.1 2-oxo-4-hydroxy-4-carboxy-5-ureidoimidazoline decarboxylase [Tsukamurella ocularis]MCS3785880.1 2-oxo-4-hydroxy-4-carboxy-5-ureidoimidazoline decarboxylase [Tsukamurella ocularis]MCS3849244.1 2-oxo-4-hydroxy-4-carboxy-5-ureidoimidazoline decarboxylase [Tsukamurella ocularis]
MDLEDFNSAPEADIRATLLACCDVRSWSDAVIDGRPYVNASDALQVAGTAALEFSPSDVDRALAAHPRIGERATGASTEAAWSRREQSGVATDTETQAALLAGNGAYEQRFDRVFLINAAGLDATTVLAELHRRLENTPDAEAAEVAHELRGIALRRLARVLELEDELAEEQS